MCSSSDAKISSDMMFSSLFTRVILFANFLDIFPKSLGICDFVKKYFLCSFLYNLLQKFLILILFKRFSCILFEVELT